MRNVITVGADPEVFVKDIATGEIQSSWGVVKGSKRNPFKTAHGFVHRDNVLAEMNVTPATSSMEFVNNVEAVLMDLEEMLGSHGKKGEIISSNLMDIKYLDHYEAARFGCNANINCWDIDRPHKPNAESAGTLRTASGHIHLGFAHGGAVDQIRAAQACELFVGLPSIAFDDDKLRRTLYGLAGSFRPKEYGIEYTVPSNFWLTSRGRMRWIYNAGRTAVNNRNHLPDISEEEANEIQTTINTCDRTKARDLCQRYGVEWPMDQGYL